MYLMRPYPTTIIGLVRAIMNLSREHGGQYPDGLTIDQESFDAISKDALTSMSADGTPKSAAEVAQAVEDELAAMLARPFRCVGCEHAARWAPRKEPA